MDARIDPEHPLHLEAGQWEVVGVEKHFAYVRGPYAYVRLRKVVGA